MPINSVYTGIVFFPLSAKPERMDEDKSGLL